jgi:8-oxo-dGTP pyrophosphatase MutT (NUDIX family)
MPTHAGGVVFRDSPLGPEYLVVEARRAPGVWVLPKGHIEKAETADMTAMREVEEEAGSQAIVIATLGTLDFDDAHVVVFLMKHQRDVPQAETRKVVWEPYQRARDRLSFQNSRDLLARAHAAVFRQP